MMMAYVQGHLRKATDNQWDLVAVVAAVTAVVAVEELKVVPGAGYHYHSRYCIGSLVWDKACHSHAEHEESGDELQKH